MTGSFCLCASADSQLKYGDALARALAARGWQSMCAIDISQPHASPRQIAELGITGPMQPLEPLAALDQGFFDTFDAVYVQSVGSAMRNFFEAFADRVRFRQPAKRPLLITGYIGLVIEKHLEGLLWRQGADVICVNSARDLATFTGLSAALGLDTAPLTRIGFPYLQRKAGSAGGGRRPRTILFATQPTVPTDKDQRLYLLERLITLAQRLPDTRVLVKPRTLPGESQFHVEKHHYQSLFDKSRDLPKAPPNFGFVYDHIGKILPETDLLVTVSSTAAVEALAQGVRVLIPTDFGISESLGNHVFVGSGLLAPLDRIEDAFATDANPSWLAANGLGAADRIETLVETIERKRAAQAALGQALPCQPIYYDSQRAPYVWNRVFSERLKAAAIRADAGHAKASAAPAPRHGGVILRKLRKLALSPGLFFADMRRQRAA